MGQLKNDGVELPGYFAEAEAATGVMYQQGAEAEGGRPFVIVLHEIHGLNAQIKQVAEQFALDRLNAFAPDLYRGKLPKDSEEASALMRQLDWGQVEEDVRRAIEAIRKKDAQAKIAVTGFCLGGAIALAVAAKIPELLACVPFYGIPADERADLTQIKAKVMAHFANIDDWCTNEKVDALEKKLKDAGVDAVFHRYDARHAFMNETRKDVYSPQNAEIAWQRTIAFLRETLK
jgi:carboxymethylenebutenolidase